MSSRLNRNQTQNYTLVAANQVNISAGDHGYIRDENADGITGGLGQLRQAYSARANNNAGTLIFEVAVGGLLTFNHNSGSGVAGQQWIHRSSLAVYTPADQLTITVDAQAPVVAVWDDTDSYVVAGAGTLLAYLIANVGTPITAVVERSVA